MIKQIIFDKIITDKADYVSDGNILHFISNDNDRPMWSKLLERSYSVFGERPNMKQRYEESRIKAKNSGCLQSYFQFITKHEGVIVDLASGPSGYFSPVFDLLKSESLFIATDASPSIISAHSVANNSNNFAILDVDLDRSLPFRNGSIDTFCGNLLSNVNNYKKLLYEIFRCLKVGGRFAVIESFYEKNSATCEFLIKNDAVYSSFETYIAYCENVGFKYIGDEILCKSSGKIDQGDLLPINDTDRTITKTVYFEKQGDL